MENTNIIYSKITMKTLEEYYQQNFMNEEDKKNLKQEAARRVFYNIACTVVVLIAVYLLYLPVWNWVRELPITQSEVGNYATKLIRAFVLYGMIWITGIYIYVKVVNSMSKHMFPLYHKQWSEANLKGTIRYKYEKVLGFQRILREENIQRIATDGYSTLTISYVGNNGIWESEKLVLNGCYAKTVKKDCLDFEWVDVAINKELEYAKYKPISI